jgi:predicted DNA-binding protein
MTATRINNRHLSIRITDEDDEWLAAFANLQNTTKSRVIREGIKLLRERYA